MPFRNRHSERGVALVLVLVILPLVAIVMTQLHFETTIGDRLAGNTLANQQFKQAILARQRQMRVRLMRDLRDDEANAQQGNALDHYSDDWGPEVEGGSTATTVSKGDKDRGDDVTLYTEVFDEQGKFNLNLLRHTDAARRNRAFETFRNLLDFFRDARFGDLEDNDWDLTEPEAQEVADAVLKFVKGEERDERVPVSELPKPTPELNQGILTLDDLNFSHRLFTEKRLLERFSDLESGQVIMGLQDYLTIHGDGKVNANTAPVQVLRAMFREPEGQEIVAAEIYRSRGGFLNTEEDQEQATQKAQERQDLEEEGDDEGLDELDQGYRNINDLQQVEGLSDGAFLRRNGIDLARDFSTRSNFFTVRITAQRENFMRQHRVVWERHPQGTITWESEVRAAELVDLPEAGPLAGSEAEE
ncbi:MAG: hypothetical protein ACYSX0_00990 [Planctomycetota bacterium]|jgi:type II secretory pathway component PulK